MIVSPPRFTDGGIFMSNEEHAAHTDPEFFPKDIDFLGFIGGWDCYTGVDTVQSLFYLIRTKDVDWLEVVLKYSNSIMSRNCVTSIPRRGSKREAAAQLLDAHVRSRVHFEGPVPPYQSGLLTSGELEAIVEGIAEELTRNSRMAAEKQFRQEAPIIKMARELGLAPRPAGHNDSAWMAGCPQSSNHWIMISPERNEFGCGYCRRKGGLQELRAFYDAVRPTSIQS
jgi:hypothetical protein